MSSQGSQEASASAPPYQQYPPTSIIQGQGPNVVAAPAALTTEAILAGLYQQNSLLLHMQERQAQQTDTLISIATRYLSHVLPPAAGSSSAAPSPLVFLSEEAEGTVVPAARSINPTQPAPSSLAGEAIRESASSRAAGPAVHDIPSTHPASAPPTVAAAGVQVSSTPNTTSTTEGSPASLPQNSSLPSSDTHTQSSTGPFQRSASGSSTGSHIRTRTRSRRTSPDTAGGKTEDNPASATPRV